MQRIGMMQSIYMRIVQFYTAKLLNWMQYYCLVGWIVLIKANHWKKWCVHNSLKRINCTKFFHKHHYFHFLDLKFSIWIKRKLCQRGTLVSFTIVFAHIFHKIRPWSPHFKLYKSEFVSLSLCMRTLLLCSLKMWW